MLCYLQGGMRNNYFQPVSHFILEMVQNMAIVTMEDE